jgi:hypothetical protein
MSDLTKRSSGASNEWIAVYITHNLPEAHIVAGRLEYEGIPAMVNQAIGRSAIGITIGRMGEVAVLVHPADYDRALEILDPEGPDELPDSTADVTYHWDDDLEDNDDIVE